MCPEAASGPVGLGLNHGLPLSPNADQPAWGRTLARLGVRPATNYQKSLSGSPGPEPAKDGGDPQLLDSNLYPLLSRGKKLIFTPSLNDIRLRIGGNVHLMSPLKYWLDLS